eukprot:3792956-Prymnesium_polylepis.1
MPVLDALARAADPELYESGRQASPAVARRRPQARRARARPRLWRRAVHRERRGQVGLGRVRGAHLSAAAGAGGADDAGRRRVRSPTPPGMRPPPPLHGGEG